LSLSDGGCNLEGLATGSSDGLDDDDDDDVSHVEDDEDAMDKSSSNDDGVDASANEVVAMKCDDKEASVYVVVEDGSKVDVNSEYDVVAVVDEYGSEVVVVVVVVAVNAISIFNIFPFDLSCSVSSLLDLFPPVVVLMSGNETSFEDPCSFVPFPFLWISIFWLESSEDSEVVDSNIMSGLNFINFLRTAFTSADPKSIKKTVKFSIFFTLLGSARVKAVHRLLMRLTPGEDRSLPRGFVDSCNLSILIIWIADHGRADWLGCWDEFVQKALF
jgi:hypothetical protein